MSEKAKPEKEPAIWQFGRHGPIQIRAQPAPWFAGCELMIRSEICAPGQRRFAYVRDLVLEERQEPNQFHVPTIQIDDREAQTLMDDLWACGLRPTEARSGNEAIAAVKYHLEDMRRLVFVDGGDHGAQG